MVVFPFAISAAIVGAMARLTPALVRAFDILDLFVDGHETLTATEVAELTGFPRSSVHELLITLDARDYLDRDIQGAYSLGSAALRLGNAYAARFDLVEIARDAARTTAARVGETCSVAVLDEDQVFYLAKAEGAESVATVSSIGRRLPAHCTGLGKAMLAALDQNTLHATLPAELPALTPNSITDHAALTVELEATRDRGYALEREESQFNLACAAAPIRSAGGDVVAAISISVPLNRWDQRTPDHWGSVALEAASRFAGRLGHRD